MAQAMQDLMAQAAAWMASYRHWLGEQGLGFSGDDLVAIQQAATTTPTPPGTEPNAPLPASTLADAERVREQAMSTVYPLGGIPPEDPRLAPVEGIPLVAVAIGASAIGFATDPTLVARAAGALGYPVDLWQRAASTWGTRVAGDMVLGVLYGQLIVQATPLPERPAGRPGAGNLMA